MSYAYRARVAAIGEVLFLVLGSFVAARFLQRIFIGTDADTFLEGDPDFWSASLVQTAQMSLRYGVLIGVILLLGFWRGRPGLKSYGVTLGGNRLRELVRHGVALGLIASIPVQVLMLVNEYVPLGAGTPFWDLMDRVDWDLSFWVYAAVGSYLLVPLVEEFTARGYTLSRLKEAYSPGGALLLMALFFAFAHAQYLKTDILAIGNLITIIFGSLCWGYSVYKTGSLVPAIVAHAIVNVPMTVEYQIGTLVISVIVAFLARQGLIDYATGIWKLLTSMTDGLSVFLVLVAIAIFSATLTATPWMPYASLAVLTVIFLFVSMQTRYREE